MKKIILVVLIIIFLGLSYFTRRDKLFGHKTAYPTPENMLPMSTGSISDIINNASGDLSQTSVETVVTGSLSDMGYEGGGEYKNYGAEAAKTALLNGKHVILYFHADWDPTDQTLDNDIQAKVDLIPKDYIIYKVNFDTETELKQLFNVTDQNTLVLLDNEGTEYSRRSIGITSLAQIVNALQKIQGNLQ